MATSKEKKKVISEKLQKILKDSKSIVFVNFKGLSVGDSSLMRRELKSKEIGYTVAKKTLINRVLDAEKPQGEKPGLDGEVALAFGADLITPAREIYNFQKKLDEKVSIIGGVFQGEYKSKEAMLTIASIPPLEVLRGMFVNIINSPIQRFAVVLGEIAKSK